MLPHRAPIVNVDPVKIHCIGHLSVPIKMHLPLQLSVMQSSKVARFVRPTGNSARFIPKNPAIVNSIASYSQNPPRPVSPSPESMGLVVRVVKEFSARVPVWLCIAVHASPSLINNPQIIHLIPC